MKNIAVITLVLAVLAAGVVGLLFIFEMMDADRAMSVLLKTVAAFALLGVCAAAISALMPAKNNPRD